MCDAVACMGRARALKSIRKRHTHAPTRGANVVGRSAAAVIGLKINARAAAVPPHAQYNGAPRHGRQRGRVRRPSAQLFQVHLSVTRTTHTLERPPPPPHLTAPQCTARCTGVRRRCTRLETKLPRHRVAETDFYRPSRVRYVAAAPYTCDAPLGDNNNNGDNIVIPWY